MVRVGGGWVALDEFLLKNDPCRGTYFKINKNIHCKVIHIKLCSATFCEALYIPKAVIRLVVSKNRTKKAYNESPCIKYDASNLNKNCIDV